MVLNEILSLPFRMFCSTAPTPFSSLIGGTESSRRRRSVFGNKMWAASLLLISTLSALTQGKGEDGALLGLGIIPRLLEFAAAVDESTELREILNDVQFQLRAE